VVKDSLDTGVYLSAFYLQGACRFPVDKKIARYLTPVLRGDAMGYDFFDKGFAVNRLTLGLNVGLDIDNMDAELRFNYEYFAKKNEPAMKENPYYRTYFERTDKGMFDKFTVELFVRF
jgi:hypothetical protein